MAAFRNKGLTEGGLDSEELSVIQIVLVPKAVASKSVVSTVSKRIVPIRAVSIPKSPWQLLILNLNKCFVAYFIVQLCISYEYLILEIIHSIYAL